MLLPFAMDKTRITRWPVVTLTVALLTLGITASVAWHAHLTRTGTWFEPVNAYWHEHPELAPIDACTPYLTPPTTDAGLPRPLVPPGDSRKLASLCVEALRERAAAQPLWLMRADKGYLQPAIVTHGLAYPNVASALVGLLLLVFVFGAFLENRWGRERFAAFWVAASVATAIAYLQKSLVGAEPFAGGNATSAACLGAFAVVFGNARLNLTPSAAATARSLAVPAWSVAIVWLVAHVAVIALSDGRTPADSAAELAGLVIGLAFGAVARLQKWDVDDAAPETRGPEPTWVQSAIVPQQQGSAQPDAAAHVPMFDDAPEPTRTAKQPLRVDAPLFVDPEPLETVHAPLVEPLHAEGGWARFATDEPVLPPKSVEAIEPKPFLFDDPPPPVSLPIAGPLPVFVEPALPLPIEMAKSATDRALAEIFEPPTLTPQPLATPMWTLLGRDHQGLLLRDEDDVPTRLDPRHLLAVAVGVVQTLDVGAPGPALIVDLIMDARPPRCVRLRPSPEALAAGWPGLTRQEAVVALMRELASGGAIRVPQVPEWPGPPWSTFPDTRALKAAWQLALSKR